MCSVIVFENISYNMGRQVQHTVAWLLNPGPLSRVAELGSRNVK